MRVGQRKGLLCYTTYVLICCKYVNIFCKDLLHNKILFWNCNKPFLCPTLISLINIFMSLITLSCFSKFIPCDVLLCWYFKLLLNTSNHLLNKFKISEVCFYCRLTNKLFSPYHCKVNAFIFEKTWAAILTF